MVDRLRLLLDRPLDPLVARAVVVFAGAILLGFAAIFVLGVSESGRPASAPEPRVPRRAQPSLPEVRRTIAGRTPRTRRAAPPEGAPRRRCDLTVPCSTSHTGRVA